MFLHIGKIHQYIVQANKDEAVKVVPQEIVHHIHKLRGALASAKSITKYLNRPHYILNAVF